MKILYIDLGSHKGEEIDLALEQIKKSNHEIEIHGFECNPELYKELILKYEKYKNIHIHNQCISQTEGKVNLYLGSNTLNSSIYSDKNNIKKENYFSVKSEPLSKFIKTIQNIDDYDFKVLKANIEGAEYDLIHDLNNNNLFIFDLYLGSGAAPISMLKDINGGKIQSLKNSMKELISILEKHNIISKRFIARYRDRSINLVNECESIYKEK